ncbi:MAG: hypothetical protein J6J30_01470 [Clostridia bacterium]|nr:hypothetical protein [Clostridia bacterium]
MVNFVLKNAFIAAQAEKNIIPYEFSPEFESKMEKLIKSQKGMRKLVNTAAKRAACVITAFLIAAFSTVFSVDALREPVVEAVQSFFVNVKEYLSGTSADNIADHFSDGVTEIVATNLITSTPKEYKITDTEKITAFTKLLTETHWGEPQHEVKEADFVLYRFEFKNENETVTTLNVCPRYPELYGIVEIISGENRKVYHISERTYLDIVAFTTRKYYLHKSDLPKPSEEKCLMWQREALANLSETEKQTLCENFKYLHLHIENLLLGSVVTLKEPDSVYWQKLELPENRMFIDPFTGVVSVDNTYHIIIERFDNSISVALDNETKNAIITMKNDFQNAVKNHDLGSIFSVHEVIHDWDYYVINYPISYSVEPPDWGGIDEYFGHLD